LRREGSGGELRKGVKTKIIFCSYAAPQTGLKAENTVFEVPYRGI
jgi:hypothetical protein